MVPSLTHPRRVRPIRRGRPRSRRAAYGRLAAAVVVVLLLPTCDATPTGQEGSDAPPTVALFCPGSGETDAFDDLASAVAAVESGGVVQVCDGTHTINQGVTLGKPLTVEPAAGAAPTLEYAASSGSDLFQLTSGRDSGDVTIQGLTLRVGAGSAIRVTPDPNPSGGRVVIRENRLEGDGSSHLVGVGLAGPVLIQDNGFEGGGATGWIQEFSGNTVTDPQQKIGITLDASIDSVRFTDNVIARAHVADSVYSPRAVQIVGDPDAPAGGITVTVTGNTITGTGGSRDPQILNSFALFTGIAIKDVDAVVELADNEIVGPYVGVSVSIDTLGTAELNAHDNVISNGVTGVYIGLNPAYATLTVAFHRNDVTGFQTSLQLGGPFPAGAVSCDWWGDAAGPQNPTPTGRDSVFTPVATAPIAGRPEVSCP